MNNVAPRQIFSTAMDAQPPHWLLQAIEEVKTDDSRFQKDNLLRKAKGVYEDLDRDIQSLKKIDFSNIVYGAIDPEEYSQHISNIVATWKKDQNPPSLTAVAYTVFEHWGVNLENINEHTEEAQMARAVLINAVLADVYHDNPYHGNPHFRDVPIDTMQLSARRGLSKNQALKVFWAATKHDLGHRGYVQNKFPNVDGEHTALFEEQHSMDIAEPYEKAVGVTDDLIKDSQVIVFGTDVSNGEKAPAGVVYGLFKHYFMGEDKPDLSSFPEIVREKMARLEGRKDLVELAKILQSGDLFVGIARGFNSSIQNGGRLVKEIASKMTLKSQNDELCVELEGEIGFRGCPIVTSLFDLPEMTPFKKIHENIVERLKQELDQGVQYLVSMSDNIMLRTDPQPNP